MKSHKETLWARDFFTPRTVTARGLVNMNLLVFIRLDSRRIIVSPSTRNTDSAWVTRTDERVHPPTEKKRSYLIHDRDTKFSASFRETLAEANMKEHETGQITDSFSKLDGSCDRVIKTIKVECLNHFIVFGTRHLDFLISEFVAYYNVTRPHCSREYLPPDSTEPPDEDNSVDPKQIVCHEHLGGLIKSYERRAA